MLPAVSSFNPELSCLYPHAEPAQSVYVKKEDLQKDIEGKIEDYEEEFSNKVFQVELNKSINRSPHKSHGPLFEKLIQAVRLKFNDAMKQKLESDLPKLWRVYQNGLTSGFLEPNDQPPILLLGTKELRESKNLKTNFKVLSDENNHRGCIFGGKWSVLKNDLVILSAIHAHKVVMLSLPGGFNANCLWNSEKRTPSMLCREISILYAAGYRRLSYSHENQLGYVLTSRNPEIADTFTLTDVTRCCANIRPELVENLFSSEFR